MPRRKGTTCHQAHCKMAKLACIALLALCAFQAAVADRDPAKLATAYVRNAEAVVVAKLADIHAETADHLHELGEYLVAQVLWISDAVFDAAYFSSNVYNVTEVAAEAQAAADENIAYYSKRLNESTQQYIPAVEGIVNAVQPQLIQLGDKAADALKVLTSIHDKHAEAARKAVEIYTAAIKMGSERDLGVISGQRRTAMRNFGLTKGAELTTASINSTVSSGDYDVEEQANVIVDVFLFAKKTILRNTEDVDSEILAAIDALV